MSYTHTRSLSKERVDASVKWSRKEVNPKLNLKFWSKDVGWLAFRPFIDLFLNCALIFAMISYRKQPLFLRGKGCIYPVYDSYFSGNGESWCCWLPIGDPDT